VINLTVSPVSPPWGLRKGWGQKSQPFMSWLPAPIIRLLRVPQPPVISLLWKTLRLRCSSLVEHLSQGFNPQHHKNKKSISFHSRDYKSIRSFMSRTKTKCMFHNILVSFLRKLPDWVRSSASVLSQLWGSVIALVKLPHQTPLFGGWWILFGRLWSNLFFEGFPESKNEALWRASTEKEQEAVTVEQASLKT
jgi:hypothetical protein